MLLVVPVAIYSFLGPWLGQRSGEGVGGKFTADSKWGEVNSTVTTRRRNASPVSYCGGVHTGRQTRRLRLMVARIGTARAGGGRGERLQESTRCDADRVQSVLAVVTKAPVANETATTEREA
jgi:hypothetical protein